MKTSLLALLLAAPVACAPVALGTSPPGAPAAPAAPGNAMKRRLVHVDHVDPAKASQFEEARRELLAAYAAKGLSEGTTTLLETKDDAGRPEFLSLRPFGAYAEIDKLNDAAAARAAAIGTELDRLDAMTHATLVPPHVNEIWLLHADLSYSPAPPASPAGAPSEADATAARLVFEEVAPPAGEAYEAAVKGVNEALRRARSPVARLAFTSSYGTGEYVTLWLARSAGELEAVLGQGQPAQAQGEIARAIELEAARSVRSTTRVAFVRRELSSR